MSKLDCEGVAQDLVVIGAGPHALTFLCTLLEDRPMSQNLVDAVDGIVRSRLSEREMRARITQRENRPPKRARGLDRITVVDRFGQWMINWRRQFSVLEIPHLRSTSGVHPDPVDPEILFEYARYKGFDFEKAFVEITGVPRNKVFRGPFQVPTTTLFNQFCEHLVDGYDLRDLVVKGEVSSVEITEEKLFRVVLDGGKCLFSKRVVVCAGHTNVKRLPDWIDPDYYYGLNFQENRGLMHAWDLVHVDFKANCLEGKVVVIVGGGLTSIQLIDVALNLGALHVHLLARGGIKVKQFDSNLLWTGRLRHEKLKEFWNEKCMERRLEMIKDARQGGSIPPEAEEKLNAFVNEGKCILVEYEEIWEGEWSNESQKFEVELSNGDRMSVDAIWLATGSDIDIMEEKMFSHVLESHPIETVSGFPSLQDDLRWAPNLDLFVIGAYAALALGPDAINLAGAKRAAFKVANCIKHSVKEEG